MQRRIAKRSSIVLSMLLALWGCTARLPENKYRCDEHADCRPELPYCVDIGRDGIKVCSSEREPDRAGRGAEDPPISSGGAGSTAGRGGAAGEEEKRGTSGSSGSVSAGSSGSVSAGSSGSAAGSSGAAGSAGAGGESAPALAPRSDAYIKADRAQALRYFGASVAVRGDLLVVGAPEDDVAETTVRYAGTPAAPASAARTDVGAAYVYRWLDGQWTMEACLAVPNEAEAHFARSVAIDEDGSRIVVGVAHTGRLPERVYLFTRDAKERWVPHWEKGLVTPPNAVAFGAAVAIYGDTLVVAAPDENPDVPEDVPEVYVYTLDDAGMAAEPPLRLTVPDSRDKRFGESVAIWGDALVVGAQYLDNGMFTNAGAAFLYRRDSGTRQWSTMPVRLDSPTPNPNDEMGTEVAIDETYVAVGTPGAQPRLNNGLPDETVLDQGAVHLYRVQDGGFEATIRPADDATKNDRMGTSVALDGERLITGAPGPREMHAFAGKAYVYRRGSWSAPERILQPRPEHADPHDRFGVAVGVSSGWLVVGSSREDSSATGIGGNPGDNASEDNGAVYAFALDAP